MPLAIIFLRYLIQLSKVRNFNCDWNIFNIVYKSIVYKSIDVAIDRIDTVLYVLSIGKKTVNMSLINTGFFSNIDYPSLLLLFYSSLNFNLTPFCRMFAVLRLLLKTRVSSRDGFLWSENVQRGRIAQACTWTLGIHHFYVIFTGTVDP